MLIDFFPSIFYVYSILYQLKHKRFLLFFVNRNPHISPKKPHVVEKIEINTAILIQT